MGEAAQAFSLAAPVAFPAPCRNPAVSLRVKVPLSLYERIGAYRHTARRDSKNQALVALISAGLAALTKPVTLPTGGVGNNQVLTARPIEADRLRRNRG